MKHDLDQMLRNLEHTEPRGAFRTAPLQLTQPQPRYIRRLLPIAAALLVLTLSVMLTVIALQRQDTTTPPDIDQGTTTPPVGTDDLAPWESGKLRVTSLTYRESANSAHFIPTDSPALIPLAEESTTVQSENIAISLAFGTPISGCGNADLLRISPREGEHTACDAVYYNIRQDEIHCLSCTLREKIAEHPLYLDAWVRAIIEEGILHATDVPTDGSDALEQLYATFYTALYDNNAPALLASGEAPTLESLGIYDLVAQTAPAFRLGNAMTALREGTLAPNIEIIEYGMQEDKCIFTLSSSHRSGIYYGAYLYDFTTATLLRLEGDVIGVTHGAFTASTTDEKNVTYDLTRALGIEITRDYTAMVATVPYVTAYIPNNEGWFDPTYAAHLVVVYDLTGGGLSVPSEEEEDARQTNQAASLRNGVVVYYDLEDRVKMITLDGTAVDPSLPVGSSVARILRLEDEDYAILCVARENGFAYRYLRLSDGSDVTDLVIGGELVLPAHAYFVFDGTDRIDTRTLERTALTDVQGTTSVCSEDERYLYLLTADNSYILCLDRYTGTTAQIPLSEDFCAQLEGVGNIAPMLLLNSSESALLLTFTPVDSPKFDLQGFYEEALTLSNDLHIHLFSPHNPAFNINDTAQVMARHFTREGQPLAFVNKTLVYEALVYLLNSEFCDHMPAYGQTLPAVEVLLTWVEHAAQRFAEVVTYDGMTATVTAENMLKLKGYESTEFRRFRIELEDFLEFYDSDTAAQVSFSAATYPAVRETIARAIAQKVVYLVTGYTKHERSNTVSDDPVVANIVRRNNLMYDLMEAQINRHLDTEQMEALIDVLTQEILANGPMPEKLPFPLPASGNIQYALYRMDDIRNEMQRLLPIIAKELDLDYTQLILQLFAPWEYERYRLVGVYNPACYEIVTGDGVGLVREDIVAALEGVTFIEGEVSLRHQASIYFPSLALPCDYTPRQSSLPICLLSAGYDENGNYYLESNGYIAQLTEEQYLRFVALCSEQAPNLSDNYEELRQECLDRAREEVYGTTEK